MFLIRNFVSRYRIVRRFDRRYYGACGSGSGKDTDKPPIPCAPKNTGSECGPAKGSLTASGKAGSPCAPKKTGSECGPAKGSVTASGKAGSPCAPKDTGSPCSKKDTGSSCGQKDTGSPCAQKETGSPCAQKETGSPCAQKETGSPCGQNDARPPCGAGADQAGSNQGNQGTSSSSDSGASEEPAAAPIFNWYNARKYGHCLPTDSVSPPFETLPHIPTGIYRDTSGEEIGPQAGKCAYYKNPEYYSFHHMTFFDMHMHLLPYRTPQIKTGRKP